MSGYAVGHVLRTSQATGTSLLVLIVIAEATHQDGTGAWPSVETISHFARTTERSVRRIIHALEASGELTIERNAGPHGTNLYAIPGVGQVRLGEDVGVSPDKLSFGHPRRRRRTTGASTPDNRNQTPDKAMSAEPSLEPLLEPSLEPARAPRAEGPEIPTRLPTRAEVEAEQHRFGKIAENAWLERTAIVGSPYTDRSALRNVHHQAVAALQWASEAQILAAIRNRLDAKSTPRRIPEWSRLEAANEDRTAHAASLKHEFGDEVIEDRPSRVTSMHHAGGIAARVVSSVAM